MKALFNAHAGARLQYSYRVCLSDTALAGAKRTLRPQLRYQNKALDARIKLIYVIELTFLSSKAMTVCSSPRIL